MNQLHTYFTDEQIAALEKIAHEEAGDNISLVVRRAVDAYITKNLKA